MVELVFVGGCPRSGTTLVQRLFGAHSAIYAGPEFDATPRLAELHATMREEVRSGRISAITDEATLDRAFRELFATFFGGKARREGARFFCEKTPDNVLVFQELAALFPEARFVFVLRDPRGIYASMKKVGERLRANIGVCPRIYRHPIAAAEEINRYWARGWAAAEMLGPRLLTLHYEDVVTAPEATARRICDFLGLPFEPGMVEIEKSRFETADEKSIANTYSVAELRKPIDPASLEKWRHDLSRTEIALIEHTIARHPTVARYELAATALPPAARIRRAAYRGRAGAIRRLRRLYRAVAG